MNNMAEFSSAPATLARKATTAEATLSELTEQQLIACLAKVLRKRYGKVTAGYVLAEVTRLVNK